MCASTRACIRDGARSSASVNGYVPRLKRRVGESLDGVAPKGIASRLFRPMHPANCTRPYAVSTDQKGSMGSDLYPAFVPSPDEKRKLYRFNVSEICTVTEIEMDSAVIRQLLNRESTYFF